MTAFSLCVGLMAGGLVQVVQPSSGVVLAEASADARLTLAVPAGEYEIRQVEGDATTSRHVTVEPETSVAIEPLGLVLVDAKALAAEAEVLPRKFELALGLSYMPVDEFERGVGFSTAFTWRFAPHFAWRSLRVMYEYAYDTGLHSQLSRDFGVLPSAFGPTPELLIGSDLEAVLWRSGLLNGFQVEAAVAFGPTLASVRVPSSGRSAFAVGASTELWLNLQLPVPRDVSLRLCAGDELVVIADRMTPVNVLRFGLTAAWRFGAAD